MNPVLFFISSHLSLLIRLGIILGVFLLLLNIKVIYQARKHQQKQTAMQWLGILLNTLLAVLLIFVLPNQKQSLRAAIRSADTTRGKLVENMTFTQISDDTLISLSDYKGDLIILYVWASWCPPCLYDLPELNKLQQKYADKGLRIITVSEEPRSHLISFFEKHPSQFIQCYTEKFPWINLGNKRPFTMIIAPDGRLIDSYLGKPKNGGLEAIISIYL